MTTVVVALLALAALRWADIRAARRGAAGLLFALLLPTSIGNPASALNVESTSRSSVFAAGPHSCVYTYDAEFFILQGPQLGSAVQALVASLSGGDQRRSAPRPCPSSLAPRYNNRSIPTTAPEFVATKGVAGGIDDHIVLGKSRGLPAQAEKIGGRHLMAADDWVGEVQAAIANPNVRISVATDGLAGSGTLRSRIMAGVQRHAGGARDASPFDQELRMLY